MADTHDRVPEADETSAADAQTPVSDASVDAPVSEAAETTGADQPEAQSPVDVVADGDAAESAGAEIAAEDSDPPPSSAAASDDAETADDSALAAAESAEASEPVSETEPVAHADASDDADAHAAAEDDAASDDASETADEAAADAQEPASETPDDDAVLADGEAIESDEDFKRPAAEVKAIVEALIFASPDPLTPKSLVKLLDSEPKEDVLAALEELKRDYERPCGLQLVEVAGGFQIVTRPDLHEWVRRLFHERSTQKLSVQALETLAVIAYRQPITAIEITEIRGVSASGVLNTLLERHLVKIVGRKQVVGRPFMYATTKEFLIRFGLKDLTDLPKVEDMAESLGIESRLLVEQTPPEEQLPLSETDGEELPFDADAAHAPADDEPLTGDDGSDPDVH